MDGIREDSGGGAGGFAYAVEHDRPIPYMQRIRDWYVGLGYGAPYRWAQGDAPPFAPLGVPLAQARVGLVTTAAPYDPAKGDQGPGAPYNAAAKFYEMWSADSAHDHDVRISHIGYDRTHTTAKDSGTWFPLPALRHAAAAGRIGAVGPRVHGVPTDRSHRATLERDCPELLARCRADALDAAILVPT